MKRLLFATIFSLFVFIGTAFAADPILNITSNPTTIAPGQSSTLSWTSENLLSLYTWTGWNEAPRSLPLNGSEVVFPAETNTYEFAAFYWRNNAINTMVGTVTVTVSDVITPGTVNGVSIKSDGAPASNAQVTIQFPATGESFETTTDSSGFFQLQDLPLAGNFVVQVNPSDGFSGSANSFISAESSESNVTVVLSIPGQGEITGTVLHENGSPAANATVSVDFMETPYTASVITGPDGSFTLAGLPTDGSLVVTAFDPQTAGHGSQLSFLTPSFSQQSLQISIKAPAQVNPELQNSNFSDGTLNGWETEGDVQVIPKSSAFPEEGAAASSFSAQSLSAQSAETTTTPCTPSPFSGLVTTAGDETAVGKLSQTFKVNVGQDTLTGRIRFVSNEWPDWYGSEYNDSYVVTLVTPGGTKVLAKGNLNSSTWGAGVAGFNGAVPEVNISTDVSAFIGKTVTLLVTVSDVGDKIYDSGVVVSDFKIIDKVARNYHSSSSWTGKTTLTDQFGQVIWLTVENVNVLGTTIEISAEGKTYQHIFLPFTSHTFIFSRYGNEPQTWEFDISSPADAFIVNYTLESTWVPGMPPNPCQ